MKPSKEAIDAGYKRLCLNIQSSKCPNLREFESAVQKMYELDSILVDLEIQQLIDLVNAKRNKISWWIEEHGKLQDKIKELNIYRNCCLRAFDLWREDHPDADIWPDGAKTLIELLKSKVEKVTELELQIKKLSKPKLTPKKEKKQYRRELQRIAECKAEDQCSCKWRTTKRDGTEKTVGTVQLYGHYDYYQTGPTTEYEVKRCNVCGGKFVYPEIVYA